jgi:hypothetical protein
VSEDVLVAVVGPDVMEPVQPGVEYTVVVVWVVVLTVSEALALTVTVVFPSGPSGSEPEKGPPLLPVSNIEFVPSLAVTLSDGVTVVVIVVSVFVFPVHLLDEVVPDESNVAVTVADAITLPVSFARTIGEVGEKVTVPTVTGSGAPAYTTDAQYDIKTPAKTTAIPTGETRLIVLLMTDLMTLLHSFIRS